MGLLLAKLELRRFLFGEARQTWRGEEQEECHVMLSYDVSSEMESYYISPGYTKKGFLTNKCNQ